MTELPVVAIGGITAETVVRLGPAGRFQAAVSAAVIGAADPGRASAAFLAILMKGRI
jgi:thiamine-phosphate pyrophosphorylase